MTASPDRIEPTFPPERMGGAGLRAFDGISREWGLSVQEQLALLRVSDSTYRRWRHAALAGRDVPVDEATLERLSYLLGIYKALRIVVPQSHAGWVRRPNTHPLFGGRPALERMMAGQVADLYVVRQYLDAWCGGWA